ncbi:MAG: MarR family transcriptional regulator [Actinomycetota bacterium]
MNRGTVEPAGIEENILAASRIMVNILAESLLVAEVDHITVPQFRILDMVQNLTDKPSEIARMLAVSPPAISSMLERLEERGLIKRSASAIDRRRIELELTGEGSSLVTRVNAHRKRILSRVLRGMDEHARQGLEGSLLDFNRSYYALKGGAR